MALAPQRPVKRGASRPEIPRGVAPGGAPVPGGIRIRQRLRSARAVAPAIAAGLAAFWADGIDGSAAISAGAFALIVALIARLLRNFPYPLRLVPASRMAVALLPVLAGALAIAALGIGDSDGFFDRGVLAGLIAGSIASILVEIVGNRMLAARPLRIAVLGAADFVPAIRRELEAIGGRHEVEVVGWLNLGARFPNVDGAQEETLARVRAAITEHRIDLLVRGPGDGSSRSGRDVYNTIAAGCLDLPVRMIDGNQLYEQVFGHVPIGTIDSAWFLFLMHPSFEASSKTSKRALDLVVGVLASVIALPLVLAGALAIKLSDGGPVFYRQRRVGERGREFEILKLRTMRVDAQANGSPRWSGADDVRVTRAGRVLRRLHVDELPQLLNVLRGDMTLVGPRPEQPQITAELERLFPHYSRRLLVKPGVTGWAQVRCGYAGSELGTAWKLCHDLFYLKHRSLLIDVLIMLETVVIAARDSHRPMRAPQPEFLYRGDGLLDAPAATSAARPMPEVPLDGPFGRAATR